MKHFFFFNKYLNIYNLHIIQQYLGSQGDPSPADLDPDPDRARWVYSQYYSH